VSSGQSQEQIEDSPPFLVAEVNNQRRNENDGDGDRYRYCYNYQDTEKKGVGIISISYLLFIYQDRSNFSFI
jgi:hypothetical protein